MTTALGKLPLVTFSTLMPKAFKAGSAKVSKTTHGHEARGTDGAIYFHHGHLHQTQGNTKKTCSQSHGTC
jgi:hypothetical protein